MDQYGFIAVGDTTWDMFRMVAEARGVKNVTEMSSWHLLAVATWHECRIARAEAELELERRGVSSRP